jgi:hypothetical protein
MLLHQWRAPRRYQACDGVAEATGALVIDRRKHQGHRD